MNEALKMIAQQIQSGLDCHARARLARVHIRETKKAIYIADADLLDRGEERIFGALTLLETELRAGAEVEK